MNQYSQLLWYRQPSQDGFNEAVVIGNGRLGASLCGYPKKERIYLNEATFWSGGPGNNIMPGAKEHLEELRKARGIKQEELAAALEVSRQTIGSLENGRYNPSILLAFKIARYFGLTIEDIFIYEEESK